MATVWELVQEYSTAPPGSTFWEHLNAQEGGGQGGGGIVLVSQIDVAIDVEYRGRRGMPTTDTTTIYRHRGDTKPILFQLWEDQENELPLDIDGFTFTFTVDPSERPIDDSNNLFQLVGSIIGAPADGKVMFYPSEVNTDLPPRTYYYDFEVVDAEGYIDTPVLAKFKIYQDITK